MAQQAAQRTADQAGDHSGDQGTDLGAAPVVIVTGGAGHVGRGLCGLFAADGWRVVVADLDADRARTVAVDVSGAGPEAFGVGVNVVDETSANRMADEVLARFGRIDALINNAGLYGDPAWTGPMLDVDRQQWDAVMAVNVWGPVACARAVAPAMMNAGWGRIINVSSHGAYKPAGVYTTSKLAVHQVTWNLARELGAHGITVNCVAPGLMDVPTAYQDKGSDDAVRAAEASYIVKRLGRAEDLYAAMRYFVSREAEWCTGQWLMVNGGSRSPPLRWFFTMLPTSYMMWAMSLDRECRQQSDGAVASVPIPEPHPI